MCEKIKKLRQFLKENNITQETAATRLGITVGAVNALLTGKRDFGRKSATAWADEFGLSEYWLMTGQGEMMQATSSNNVDVLMLPVINLDTRAGLGSYNEVVDTPLYIAEQMPFSRSIARDGDFVMPVVGESMTPRYPNGTYVLVRPLPTWREYLELGAAYVLELLDGRRLIKEIRAGSDADHFTLQSVNPAFEPSEIAKNFIAHIFAVIVSVRRDYNW